MKLVALNLNHKASLRAIKPRFVEAIEKLQPDVLTLNEYVHGDTRAPLLEALAHIGLSHVRFSERLNGNNQVLVASRHELDAGALRGPATEDGGGESNFLHVELPQAEIEIVGVRAPAYEADTVLRDYWQKLVEIIRSAKHRRIVFIGDLNADPEKARGIGTSYLAALKQEGWVIPSPAGSWSYISGSRIDHAIAAPGIVFEKTEYVAEIGDIAIASQEGSAAVSDHAALVAYIANAA